MNRTRRLTAAVALAATCGGVLWLPLCACFGQAPGAAGSAPGNFPFQLGGGSPPAATGFPFQLGGNPPQPAPAEEPDPNRDIAVTPEVGEWMICVASYTGPESHVWARGMVALLREPGYRLPAYVFNRGAEERRKERERIQEILRSRQKLEAETGTLVHAGKMRIPRYANVEDQVAVLIGGYRDMDTARRALDEIRKLPAPDPKRVKLDGVITMNKEKGQEEAKGQLAFRNPFKHGFVVRNPSLPPRPPADRSLDVAELRRLNEDEPYSLLKCKKKITLAIREFQLPTLIQSETEFKGLLKKASFLTSASDDDAAAKSANNLAEFLNKKVNMEAYVLHTKFSSVVTVGGFDSLDDPRVQTVRAQVDRMNQDPRYDQFKLFPVPRPMQVPH